MNIFKLNFSNELFLDYFKRIIKRLGFIIILILLWPFVSFIFSFNETIQSIALILLFILIIENATRIVSRTIIYLYLRSNNLELGKDDLFILGTRNVSNVIKYIIVFFVGLIIFGIQIQEFFTTMSIVAVALVWGFKEFIFNFFAGMYLLFSKNVEINKYAEINEIKGKVLDISYQTIKMKTDSGNIVYIPNYLTVTNGIINHSKENLKKVEIEISLLRDEMPLIKKIEKELNKKLVKEFSELINQETPLEFEYKEILSKKVSFVFIININKYTFNLENKIQQVAYKIIGDLLIKYHENEKNKSLQEINN